MGVSARLCDFPVLLLVAFGLLVSAPHARADDAFVLQRHLPTLRSLVPPAHAQTAASIATASAEPLCDIFANGYDGTGATPCAGCFDAALNFTETDVDCGGGNCKACADGKHCAVGSDCSSTVCNTSTTVCAPVSCADSIKDGSETDIDCGGGICPACAVGKNCSANSDCTSNACDAISHSCVASQCIDHGLDGLETDIDCGGGICPTCAVGKMCILNGDCTSTACNFVTNRCVTGLCFDQRKDGTETDIDCGGANACNRCGVGLNCMADSDCTSNACDATTNTCVANQCADNRKDGSETDVDCGGANTCNRCSIGLQCLVNEDCAVGHTCNISTPHVCM